MGGDIDATRLEASLAVSPEQTVSAVSVVIACFDLQRFQLLVESIEAVRRQDLPNELIVVVDNNEDMYWKVLDAVPGDVTVIRNSRARGAGGARNTAALKCTTRYLAFLDDDAIAQPGWLRSLVETMNQPDVLGAGGLTLPRWQAGRPWWFPPELGWTIGTSFPESSDKPYPVRNVWSCNMIVDREAFQAVNGFNEHLSKVGESSQPEDTEFCLRVTHADDADRKWMMVPNSQVYHFVPARRATIRYIARRCWLEGTGKVHMRATASDRDAALSDERSYLTRTVPRALTVGIVETVRYGRFSKLGQSAVLLFGLSAATVGALKALAEGFLRGDKCEVDLADDQS